MRGDTPGSVGLEPDPCPIPRKKSRISAETLGTDRPSSRSGPSHSGYSSAKSPTCSPLPSTSGTDRPSLKLGQSHSHHSSAKALKKSKKVKEVIKARKSAKAVSRPNITPIGSVQSLNQSESLMSVDTSEQASPMSARSASPESDIPSGQPFHTPPPSYPLSPRVVLARQSGVSIIY